MEERSVVQNQLVMACTHRAKTLVLDVTAEGAKEGPVPIGIRGEGAPAEETIVI